MDQELDGLPPCNQMTLVSRLPLGESYSIAQRMDLTYGLSEGARSKVGEQLRARLEQLIHKARREKAGKMFRTEVLYALAQQSNALFIVCVCTRTK